MENKKTEPQNLKEVISILYDMELNNYFMTSYIQKINAEILQLGHPRTFSRPVPKEVTGNTDGLFMWGLAGTFIGAIVGGIGGCNSSYGLDSIGSGFSGLLGGGVLGLLFGFFVGCILYAFKKDRQDEEYQKQYDSELSHYQKCVRLDKLRVEKENQMKVAMIAARDQIRARREEAQRTLNGFYMRAGIAVRFRNLIPIAKMHEIISLDITSELTGDNGLYDRVRQELREDDFYRKMDEIASKLDTIISNQDAIYGQLQELNGQCNKLVETTTKAASIAVENNQRLNEIADNSGVAAYNSDRILAEQRYQSALMTFSL